MYVGNQMVSGTTLQTNMAATRTVIVEVKYISSKNVVIHSENCKVEIPFDITAQQLSKKMSYDWHLRAALLGNMGQIYSRWRSIVLALRLIPLGV